MNDYLDIFNDVLLIASFQPRQRERLSSAQGFHEPERGTHRARSASVQDARVLRLRQAKRSRTIGMTLVP